MPADRAAQGAPRGLRVSSATSEAGSPAPSPDRSHGCSTPGAAVLVSARSRPLWCLQLPGLQLGPTATIGPARLRCAACALVANLGTGSLVARPPWFRDSAGTAPDGCWAIAGHRNHGDEIVRFGGLPLLVGRLGDCRVRREDRRTVGPRAKCSPHPELRARRGPKLGER
jgi:hypothetical protein